jgi:hypothetical protein
MRKNAMRNHLTHGALLTIAISVLSPTVAFATPPQAGAGAGSTDAARQHYDRGVKLYEEEDYRAALIEFKRAYEIAPNTAVLFNIGQSYYQLLDYANALTTFEKYQSEAGADIPAARKAQVTSEVEELRGRVARVTVTVNVPDAEIFVDDTSVGKSPLSTPLLVSAGRRKITAQKAGKQAGTKIVEAAGGDQLSVQLDLADLAVAGNGPMQPSGPTTRTEPASYLPAYIGIGVAVVGVGVGAIFGGIALGNKSTLDSECQNKTCPNNSQSDIDTMSRNATISTIGFAVGIVGAGVAVVDFIIAKPHVVEDRAAKNGFSITPMIGPVSAGFSGRF